MYCPICATPAPVDQKFCRLCGLNLKLHMQLLAGQSSASGIDYGEVEHAPDLRHRAKRMRLFGFSLIVGCLAFLLTYLVVSRGLPGIGVAALFVTVAAGTCLVSYAESLRKQSSFHRSSGITALSPAQSNRELPEEVASESIPSVTENTTELLEDHPRPSVRPLTADRQ